MSLLNNLKRYLYGSPGMEYGRENLGQMEGSQGLIGTGGESGGGLLQDSFSKMNNVEGGLLSNIPEGALLGAALYGQGLKGKDPLAGAFPAVIQAAQIKKLTTPKTELQKNLEAAGYKAGSEEYKAALNAYLNKGKTNTLSKEALALYKQGQAAGDDFNSWFDNLNKAEKDLYNKQVKPNLNSLQAAFEFVENQEKKILETAPPIPMMDGSLDVSKVTPGIVYNLNGQAVVYDDKSKQLIPYKKYLESQ